MFQQFSAKEANLKPSLPLTKPLIYPALSYICIYFVFVFKGAPCGFSYKTFQEDSIAGYKRTDLQLSQMKMYNLTYGHYERDKDSEKMLNNLKIC